MSNENLEIKYFQIGDEPNIYIAYDIESIKVYLLNLINENIKNGNEFGNDSLEMVVEDINDGKYKDVGSDYEYNDDNGDSVKVSCHYPKEVVEQLGTDQVLVIDLEEW
ncbi:hypothetical protein [Snodgrassella alvi]|uniref:hypothetical protein n=1 Tax=Snodgrassella alvi TaxID=1196083 RepID=UPI001182B4A2|nr:hypothetical protein [Snodgrassella alvi]